MNLKNKILSKIKGLLFQHKLRRFARKKRYEPIEIIIEGRKFKAPDAHSFAFTYDEIFNKEIYSFESTNNNPLIIDCGANIGLSILFFKKLYPSSNIIAFEPDPTIYSYLTNNLDSYAFDNVVTYNLGVWKEQSTLKFWKEGSDAGRIISPFDSFPNDGIEIPTVRLSKYLSDVEKVDLLKIDIEGAELDVVQEISGHMHKIERLFVEYHSFKNSVQHLDVLLSLLKLSGFRYIISTPIVFNKKPFKRMVSPFGMDMVLNIHCFKSS